MAADSVLRELEATRPPARASQGWVGPAPAQGGEPGKEARGRGGEVVLRRVPPRVARILECTRLDTIFTVVHDHPPTGDDPDREAA